MSSMTVLELFQCIFWAIAAVAPVIFGMAGGNDDDNVATCLLGVAINVAALIAAYKAGGK